MPEAPTTQRPYGDVKSELIEARSWIGFRVTDKLGSGLGRLEDVWADAVTGDPAWLLLREGRFGGSCHKLVPFAGSTAGGGQVWLSFEREIVRTSPDIGDQEVLTERLSEHLRSHYAQAGQNGS